MKTRCTSGFLGYTCVSKGAIASETVFQWIHFDETYAVSLGLRVDYVMAFFWDFDAIVPRVHSVASNAVRQSSRKAYTGCKAMVRYRYETDGHHSLPCILQHVRVCEWCVVVVEAGVGINIMLLIHLLLVHIL